MNPPTLQITLGKKYTPRDIHHLHQLFHTWGQGFLAWPWLDIPLTPFAKAMRARRSLLEHFQAAVNAACTELDAEREVAGIIAGMVAAEDEEGSRWVDSVTTQHYFLHTVPYGVSGCRSTTFADCRLHISTAIVETYKSTNRKLALLKVSTA